MPSAVRDALREALSRRLKRASEMSGDEPVGPDQSPPEESARQRGLLSRLKARRPTALINEARQQLNERVSSYSAEQRIASFLLGVSSRYARVGLSPNRFHLPMTRGDIGEYLGLTVETVSRLFTSLQKKGLISVDNREIALLDKEQLRVIVGADEF